MPDRRTLKQALWLLLGTVLGAAGSAHGADRVRLGLLDCSPAEPSGLILGAGTTLECRFLAPGAPLRPYAGLVETDGADPATTPGAGLVWEVEATGPAPAALDGGYATAPAGSTPARSPTRLVGGPGAAVTLTPASIVSQRGTNLAGGVTRLKLKAK